MSADRLREQESQAVKATWGTTEEMRQERAARGRVRAVQLLCMLSPSQRNITCPWAH